MSVLSDVNTKLKNIASDNSKSSLLLVALFIYLLSLILTTLIMSLLNTSMVNYAMAPIFQYLDIFKLIWPERPFGSLQFLATKSLFALAHKDPRGGLHLWTLEYDTISIVTQLALSLLLAKFIQTYLKQNAPPKLALVSAIGGIALLFLTFTYTTVIEHCSGATWAGYVMLYGLGMDEADLTPLIHGLSAFSGFLLYIAGLYLLFRSKKKASEALP